MTEPAEGGVPATGAPGTEATALGAGRKVLLVDDDAPLRRSMARALERRGFSGRGGGGRGRGAHARA